MSSRALTKAGTFANIFAVLTVMPSLPKAAELGRLLMALIVSALLIVLKIISAAEEQREHSHVYGQDADWNLHLKYINRCNKIII